MQSQFGFDKIKKFAAFFLRTLLSLSLGVLCNTELIYQTTNDSVVKNTIVQDGIV